ncbi:probable splicing factor, arginine/serine-rich 6 [Hyalella azteca]|nr:probable splicing factor, arginine/serine-rich 6 [Hyalella azteca]
MDCKVYVGDLGSSANKHDLEDAFSQYGRLTSVWVARNPPGFAFVEFEDNRDAEDAVRALDGRTICGRRVRVEMSTHGTRGGRPGGGRGGFGGRGAHPDDKCFRCGDRGHFARDCRGPPGGRRSYSRSRSPSPRRRRSMSRSVSRDRRSYRSRSRSPRRSRSPSYTRGGRSSRSPARRSRSPVGNGRSRSPANGN